MKGTLEFCFFLQASFLEIYNEEIRDLLAVEKDLKYEVGIVSFNCTKMVLLLFYTKVKMTDSKGSDVMVTNLRTEEVCDSNWLLIYIVMVIGRKRLLAPY